MTTRFSSIGLALATAFLAGSVANAKTLEEVKAKIHAKVSGYKTLQYKVKMESDMSMPQMSVKSTVDMAGAYMKKGDKILSRIEQQSVNVQSSGGTEQKTETTALMVSDGEFNYTYTENMGAKQAAKQRVDPEIQHNPFDATKMFKQLEETFVLKLLPSETINGKHAQVIEMTAKDEAMRAFMGRRVSYFDQGTGIEVKVLQYDAKGKVTSTTTLTDVKIDGDISLDRFVFTAPPGVEVIDQTQQP